MFLAQRKIAPRLIIESIINEEDLELEVTAYFGDWRELKGVDAGAYNLVLLFDGVRGGLNRIAESLGIARDKLVPLW